MHAPWSLVPECSSSPFLACCIAWLVHDWLGAGLVHDGADAWLVHGGLVGE